MRIASIFLIPLLSIGLSGCITKAIHQAQRQERLKQAEARIEEYCQSQGYKRGTELGLKCRIALTQSVIQHDAITEAAWQQADARRRAALLGAGIGMMNRPVTRPMTNCTAVRQGVYTHMNCF